MYLTIYLYIHVRLRSSNKNHTKVVNELIPAAGFKWETRIKNNQISHISDIPLCPEHELKLNKFDDKYCCTDNSCKLSLDMSSLDKIREVAINHIERYVRQKY